MNKLERDEIAHDLDLWQRQRAESQRQLDSQFLSRWAILSAFVVVVLLYFWGMFALRCFLGVT